MNRTHDNMETGDVGRNNWTMVSSNTLVLVGRGARWRLIRPNQGRYLCQIALLLRRFYQLQMKETFFENVAQDVEKRIEIDYVEVRGAAFEEWDQRAMLAHLVSAGLAEVVCFPTSGSPAPPIEVLHQKRCRARARIV